MPTVRASGGDSPAICEYAISAVVLARVWPGRTRARSRIHLGHLLGETKAERLCAVVSGGTAATASHSARGRTG